MLEAYQKDKTLKALEKRLLTHTAEVKQSLDAFLNTDPLNTHALFLAALCQVNANELNAAMSILETLLKQDPDHVSGKVELAKILFIQKDVQGAIKLLVEATDKEPEIVENWRLLSEYFQQNEQIPESNNALNQYNLIKAFNNNLWVAEQAFTNGDYKQADQLCRQLLQQVPTEVRALRLLAKIAKQLRYFEISTSLFERCVEIKPDDAELGIDYAYALLASKKHKAALEQCQRIIGLAPEEIEIYVVKAGTLVALGQYNEAIAIYRELAAEHEQRALCLLRLGNVLKTVGNTEEAVSCYQQAIEIEPTLGEAYWNLANLKTYQFSPDEIASMQKLVKASEKQSLNKVHVQFALGKALEDAQQFEESFQHYQLANSDYAKLRSIHYVSHNDALKSYFNTDIFSARKQAGNPSDAPVFIVGLPRSGSTLVEQILTSHSQVDGTMELTEMISIARELDQPNRGKYPQSLSGLSATQVNELAQRYLDYVQPMRQQAPYFVDKQPGNFHHIGLIKTLFPNAKIIDVRRNPMASGWSLYKHFFAEGFLFSYDLATIGQYYNDYIELMEHWHSVLPKQILTVNYEDLVNDLPGNVDAILNYCGLDFEEACLNYHLNKRSVNTASSEQVRQPLYTQALDHWKNYEEFLAPLKQAVGNDDLAPEN